MQNISSLSGSWWVSNKKKLKIHVSNPEIYLSFNLGLVCGYNKQQYNIEEFSMIIICSIVLHLLIEAPFNTIRKLIFDKRVDSKATVKKID